MCDNMSKSQQVALIELGREKNINKEEMSKISMCMQTRKCLGVVKDRLECVRENIIHVAIEKTTHTEKTTHGKYKARGKSTTSGNRTRVSPVAGEYSTTRPMLTGSYT